MTDLKTIRWGIAGTGAIARQFAGDMVYAKDAALAAVCSRDHARAQDFARRRSSVRAYGSLTAMLDSNAVDAVYLATPNMVHLAQALECVAAGIPVLVEKPMSINFDATLEIQAAARAAGVFVMEAMWSRYLPAIQAARDVLINGAIGTVRRLEADLAFNHAYDPQSRFYDKAQGGGALLDLGIYPISLARYFLGDPVKVEGSWIAAPTGVDRAASLRMRFGDADAVISCAFDREGSNRMIIEGDKGVLVLGPLFIQAKNFGVYPSRAIADLAHPDGTSLTARIQRKLFQRISLPGTARHGFGFEGTGLQFEIEAASKAIREGLMEEADNTLDDTIAALRIIDKILSNASRDD